MKNFTTLALRTATQAEKNTSKAGYRHLMTEACGSGKSTAMANIINKRVAEDNMKVLVIYPKKTSRYQLEKYGVHESKNVTMMTFSMLVRHIDAIQRRKFDFLVIDEAHAAGAEKTLAAIKAIIKNNENIRVLGATATPTRMDDTSIIDELFTVGGQSRVSNSSPLAPTSPVKYINMLGLDVNEHLDLFTKKAKLKRKALKNGDLQFETLIDPEEWEAILNVPEVFKKNLGKRKAMKFIVFCPSFEAIDRWKPVVTNWMTEAYKEKLDVQAFEVSSRKSDADNDDIRKQLARTNEKGIELYFSVNMLNDSIHASDLTGIIMLRKTASPIIRPQQIGRCMIIGQTKETFVFDFVNNINRPTVTGLSSEKKPVTKQEVNAVCKRSAEGKKLTERQKKILLYLLGKEMNEEDVIFQTNVSYFHAIRHAVLNWIQQGGKVTADDGRAFTTKDLMNGIDQVIPIAPFCKAQKVAEEAFITYVVNSKAEELVKAAGLQSM